MRYPNNIKKIRESKDLTQGTLSEAVGMSRSYLGQLELGLVKTPRKYVEKLCIFLNVTKEELLGYTPIEKIDDAAIKVAIEIIDSAVDASDLTENQRMDLVKHAYKMVTDAVEKKLTINQLQEEINLLRKKIDEEVSLIKETKSNIFNFFKNSSKK